MSEDVDREKVLQTTKVRTSLKSDLSWIHREKKTAAQDIKESTETAEEAKLPTQRQLSYVLMTTKKFEPEVSPHPLPGEKPTTKNGSVTSSDGGLQNGKHSEPVSPDPTAAATITDEKNEIEPPKSSESAEGLTHVEVNGVAATEDNNHVTMVPVVEEIALNGCSADTETTQVINLPEQESCENTETLKVSNTAPMESAPNAVPDILAESVFKSSPPQENGKGQWTNVATVFDILSDTLVGPILNVEAKEAEGNPSSEMVADQIAPDFAAETLSSGDATTEQPATEQSCKECIELPKVPEIDTSSAVSKDCIEESDTSSAEIPTVVSSDLPQDKGESNEPQSSSTKEDIVVLETTSADDTVAENTVEPARVEASEETTEEPKVSDILVVSSDVAQDNVDPQQTQSTSTNEDIVEPGTISSDVATVENNGELVKAGTDSVEEPKASDIAAISSDVPQAAQSTVIVSGIPRAEVAAVQSGVNPSIAEATEETVDVPELPSAKEDTTIIAEEAVAQENVSHQGAAEGSSSEAKEEIVDQNVQESADLEMICPSQSVAESTTKDVTGEPAPDSTKDEVAVITKEIVMAESTENANVGIESVGTAVEETNVSETEPAMDATPGVESPEASIIVQAPAESLKEDLEESTVECPTTVPALLEINQDATYKAEPAVVVSSPESTASEVDETNDSANVEEASGDLAKNTMTETKIEATQAEAEVESAPEVPAVTSEALFDIKDALTTKSSSENSKEEGEPSKLPDEKVDTAVTESDEPKDSKEEQQPTDNSAPNSVEEEATTAASFIMRDGKEVCSHCDQFIGLIKLTFSYPPMYLHPECLKCGMCTKDLGDLLTPMFEHKQLIYCSDCYDEVYSLD